jgi:hypothetical protein
VTEYEEHLDSVIVLMQDAKFCQLHEFLEFVVIQKQIDVGLIPHAESLFIVVLIERDVPWTTCKYVH